MKMGNNAGKDVTYDGRDKSKISRETGRITSNSKEKKVCFRKPGNSGVF